KLYVFYRYVADIVFQSDGVRRHPRRGNSDLADRDTSGTKATKQVETFSAIGNTSDLGCEAPSPDQVGSGTSQGQPRACVGGQSVGRQEKLKPRGNSNCARPVPRFPHQPGAIEIPAGKPRRLEVGNCRVDPG